MSRFYRLTITERVATLEVIVELPGSLWEGQSKDVVHPRLNVVAADAVRQRWRMLHPEEDYPPIMPEHFELEPLWGLCFKKKAALLPASVLLAFLALALT